MVATSTFQKYEADAKIWNPLKRSNLVADQRTSKLDLRPKLAVQITWEFRIQHDEYQCYILVSFNVKLNLLNFENPKNKIKIKQYYMNLLSLAIFHNYLSIQIFSKFSIFLSFCYDHSYILFVKKLLVLHLHVVNLLKNTQDLTPIN